MSIVRTQHIAISINYALRLSDEILAGAFTTEDQPLTADEARTELIRMRDEDGLTYIPCACENQNADGSCMGWTRAKAA